mmetsp:Transcript_14704/g.43571  ORF Transcript_14704/g.43571 Transcript_14704/m.43571 type:complete len:97 (+) Transcript_14704:50-340(+)
MNPITAWIYRNMESPGVRERQFEARVTRNKENCERFQADLAKPNHTSGFWREQAAQPAGVKFTPGFSASSSGAGSTSNQTNSVDAALAFFKEESSK